ncbi:MAG: PBSX family phage terminase large subunit [Clostridia bacterium]|nr:PBSX family phage terminase large subunit [Clostridia bacterium]
MSKPSNRTFESFSRKQLEVLSWWCPSSPHKNCDAIICDGAVRSGKTVCMSVSFAAWACANFDNTSFALCGKTVTSLRRNIVTPILPLLKKLGFVCHEKLSQHLVEIEYGGRRNRFYLFGGKDEGSAALIQGMTLGGVLLDEVALMPRSFVEQALARCSVEGSKLWFNCNPDTPMHWFYEEWIKKADSKNCLYLHFTMKDNPSLTPAIIKRYESLYSGAFYDRFVLGKWVAAQGLVYPSFSASVHVAEPSGIPLRYFISCDYGTVNPSSFGLWGEFEGRWYRLSEYYFDSRREGVQRTDEEHYAALEALAGDLGIEAVIADPSAASFLECIRRHGRFKTIPAKNDVVDGIRRVSDALKSRRILFSPSCRDTLREFSLYRWDNTATRDAPKKENDHAMDDIRYFVSTVLHREDDGFFALAMQRNQPRGRN